MATAIKDRIRNPLFANIVLENIFPILGFFLWDWNLYYIFLFYFLDFFASEFSYGVKLWHIIRKPGHFHGFDPQFRTTFWKLFLFQLPVFLVVFFICAWLSTLTADIVMADLKWQDELQRFFQNEYIFVIAIFFAQYMYVRMTFLMPRRYVGLHEGEFFKRNLLGLGTTLIGLACLFGFANIITFNEISMILMIISVKMVLDIFVYNRLG
ncbi:MAG: hypothetical protein KDC84_14465 [Crocinitomicaceae bacterium]|nr:hypothetical protein [Crocinitomicaceae bacterium]